MLNTQEMRAQCDEASQFLKLLANPNRLAILCSLHEQRHNVTELSHLLDMPQAALSNQLMLLKEAGFVACEIKHRERIYYLTDERIVETIALLHRFFCHTEIEA
ncbi:helix-turn-helix transcriptional regulator [Pelistega sp. MC2]|uniref:ArsR/SmtB family transcription factor n=1 Tax=Pelistega sp. MC2 TaxID=1720297 RepID=UPI0008DA0911|nr:metalloregulator ArsR/SmtB family transcription factor [Pelistega sp. MC2]